MKQLRQLCGTVLIMEAVVIGLAIPVAIVLEHLRHGVAGGVGGGLAVCALILGGLVGRPGMRWALWAGTILQVLVIAAGVVVPAMYVLGVIFAALWVTGIWLARRLQTPPPPAHGSRDVSASSVAAPAVSAPATPADPAVTAPAVTAPSVAAPAVSAPADPAVTAPAVTAPAVTAPAVTAPAVTAPSVAAPSVGTPGPDAAQPAEPRAPQQSL